ncbi:ABC transporter permease [Dyadobacter chenwenxiniae]|uniref:ABC transporter permease n=1 Tax=Dyadobacter chenwenxiniae TaxID=2906456 RepID=A0A9X1PMU4_9BACT|nr:ABC transporter permease [Dyadobacter chenwenxiniae]MCF0062879.1 ABC transporter permease [Dyadobacter chenwenxiniae]UON84946.1 ABC transporter permease [Dyadobacter chenwenxiniae]
MKATGQPPRWATRFLQWYCRPRLLEDLEGDLFEYFERNVKNKGLLRARIIYVIDVLKFLRPYTFRKIDFFNLFIHWIMIGSYLKTSRRSLVRNKLFSLINIIGLAVSMSVGLLVITVITDLNSYDDFHQGRDRIYRVITSFRNADQPPMELASTLVKAGQKIRETVAGAEQVTTFRNGFSGDARVGNSTFPLEAIWADNSFLKVFTFPLVKGDVTTALQEPYALVLSEKTARKMFGEADPIGKPVMFDTTSYVVRGVVKDLPKLSHIRFDMLVSFATIEAQQEEKNNFYDWDNIWSNYVYVLMPEHSEIAPVNAALAKISKQESAVYKDKAVSISLESMKGAVLGGKFSNNVGPAISPLVTWVLSGLAFVIILSACFNYTNLSVARSLRRSREVGIRKIIGARKSHVLGQFMAESVIIAMLALVFSLGLFLFLKKEFLALDSNISDLLSLDLSFKTILYFIALACLVGLAAGFLPALFFSRINALLVMKDMSNLTLFRRIGMRKALIVIQYTLSLFFIAATLVGHSQYKSLLRFDLGFETENIVNIRMQGNNPDVMAKEFAEIPVVKAVSRSLMITSLGSYHGSTLKYGLDSNNVWLNLVDEHYMPLHDHKLLAGTNFKLRPGKGKESEVIVNEQVLKRFNIAKRSPENALGKVVTVDGQALTIIGVIKDFHYGTLEAKIEPVIFRYSANEPSGYLNVKIASGDLPGTMDMLETAWRKVDKVHPIQAKFYNDQIESAYSQFSVMVKVVGFVAFLAICIASLGLFGMVVFTTETKLKEISIRKVLGASEGGLVYLLCEGFLILLIVSALIAIPATYFFFDKIVLDDFPYHQPINILELLAGVLVVMLLAFLMIGSQTVKAARNNPAKVLKSE